MIYLFIAFQLAASPGSKWYRPVDIGRHLDRGKVTQKRISPERAIELFRADDRIGSCALTDEGKGMFEPATRKLIRSAKPWFRTKRSKDRALRSFKGPLAVIVREFSTDEVRIWVVWKKGHSRWHSFFDLVAEYLVKRSGPVDGLFFLDQLEQRYALTYQGIGHGTTVDELTAKLGTKHKEYPGQSPSFRNLYFPNHELHVVIQESIVMYVERERPGWADSP